MLVDRFLAKIFGRVIVSSCKLGVVRRLAVGIRCWNHSADFCACENVLKKTTFSSISEIFSLQNSKQFGKRTELYNAFCF